MGVKLVRELLLLEISGPDKTGLTAELSSILARYNTRILDIGQEVIHNHLSLGMLVEVPNEFKSAPVLKDLLFMVHTLGLQISFTPISDNEYEKWVKEQGKPRYLLTLLAREIKAEQIARVSTSIARHNMNIDTVTRLSGRLPLQKRHAEKTKACVEFSVRGILKNEKRFREEMLAITDDLGVDILPRLTYLSVEEPAKREAGVKVADVAELVSKLKNEAKVI
jgi:phosphoserine phosphatase